MAGLLYIPLLAVALALAVRFIPRADVPQHLAGHPVFEQDELIPKETRLKLLQNIRDMKTFMSNIDTAKSSGVIATHDHIGEAIPINADGTCSHQYLFPNNDRTRCILPERIDVGRHFIQTGGLDGVKESFDVLMDRVSSFARYKFNKDVAEFPVVRELFESENFQTAAKSVCPADQTYLDPFQFTFIINLPGQTVAAHLDAPYFWGANRFRFPQWLLVAMVFSNLFQDQFIHQIQVVGYLHEWPNGVNPQNGGDFVFHANSSYMGTVISKPGAGTIVDGSKVIHAAKIYRPEVVPPHLEKDKFSQLVHLEGDNWELRVADEVVQRYTTQDFRISMVYRARCFASAEEATRYATLPEEEMMSLENVLNTLQADLIKRGVTTQAKLDTMPKLDLAFLIIDTYIKYPLAPVEAAWMPYNYCAIPRAVPWAAPLFNLFC